MHVLVDTYTCACVTSIYTHLSQILQLNSLSIYWDTDTQLFGDLPSSDWLVTPYCSDFSSIKYSMLVLISSGTPQG